MVVQNKNKLLCLDLYHKVQFCTMWYKQARNIDFDFTIFLWYNIPKNIFYCDVVPGQILNAAAQGGGENGERNAYHIIFETRKEKTKKKKTQQTRSNYRKKEELKKLTI